MLPLFDGRDKLFKCTSPDIAERRNYLQDFSNRIKESSSILILGGGATAVETAGEILHEYPDKKLTVVHRGNRLVSRCPPLASRSLANDILGKKNADVLFRDTVPCLEVMP